MTFFKAPFLVGIFVGAALVSAAASDAQSQADVLRAQILAERPAPLTHLNVVGHVSVNEFGAVPGDGKDDRVAVHAAIQKARSMDGPVQIDFNPGVYDFSAEAPDYSNGTIESVLPLQNCRNIIVDGHGAQILIQRQDVSFAGVHTSTNLIVRNFSIDYDPLPFSQGTVEQISPADLSFVMKLHVGFPSPDDPFFKSCGSWGMLKDTAHPGRLKADCPAHFFYKEIVPLGDDRFRVVAGSELEMSHIEPGDVFVINGRSASIGRYFSSENITFDHLTANACPGSLFVGAQTSQLNVLNCKGLLKDNRLIVSGADGVHCQAARIGPWVENCEFEGLSDDCLNIYGLPIYVLEQVSPTQLTVYARAEIHPGDTLVFFNPTAGKVLQEITVVSYTGAARREASDTVYPKGTLILSDPLEPLNIAPVGTPMDMRGWKTYDHAYNVDAIGNHFVYRKNHMHDGRRYGVFIKASRGLIEDNIFEGLSCNGMQIANEPDWPEGFRVRDLVIQNNRISECGYGRGDPPIAIVAEKIRGRLQEPLHGNIFLLNNVLDAVSGPALVLSGVDGLIAEGNTFTSGTETGPLIDVHYSKNIDLESRPNSRTPADRLKAEILKKKPAPLAYLNVVAHVNVREFGALPNDGKDDRAAVAEAVEKAKSMQGPVQINFESGRYDFSAVSQEFSSGNTEEALLLQQCSNLVVDGHGAEILIHRQNVSFARVRESTNLIVRNFTVDYDPLPFSQGSIEEVNPADASFVFKLHSGFPRPDDPFFKSCNSWGMLKDPEHPGRLKPDCPSFFMYSEILSLGDNRFKIGLASRQQISSVESGDVFVINGRSASIGKYSLSGNITFDRLTVHACPSAVFLGSQTSQLNVLNCRVQLKGNRLITAGADGVHCQSARIGPWIENCDFEGLSDDCLNIYGLPIFILSRSSPTEMVVHARARIKPGDPLVFFNPNEGRVIQETTVVSFSGNRLVVKDPVGKLNLAPPGTAARGNERDWKIYDHIYNLNTTGNGFVYRNNTMHDGRRYGLLLRTGDGLIENNRFEGLSDSGMNIANEPSWPEGFWARNLVIRNNQISECGYGYGNPSIRIIAHKLNGYMTTPIQKNIYIQNNVLHAVSGPALELSGVDGLVAEGNTFTSGSETGPLIRVQYSEDIQFSNNQGDGRIEMRHMDQTELQVKGN